MRQDLYGYTEASYEECIDDLNRVIEHLEEDTYIDSYNEDAEVLERLGIRLQNIANRLKELQND